VELKNQVAVVTGGSRGLGRATVKALAAEGTRVWAVARDRKCLDELAQDVKDVQTIRGDVTDPEVVDLSIREVQPNILILNAGAIPVVAPIQEQTWEQFNGPWETDVKATFQFGRAALIAPLAPGSVVIIMSSGAAFGGATLSGGYAGAKRTQWLMGQYLQQDSDRLKLGIRFIVLVPQQIVSETELGASATSKYAQLLGVSEQQYRERTGTPFLTAEMVGQGIVSLLRDDTFQTGLAFGLTSQGLKSLD
jgi:NAD(P)-dependent dehydrogenase (short-subunit alcohol dehydrogenase family)